MNTLAHICAYLSRQAYADAPELRKIGQTLVARYDRNGTQAFISTESAPLNNGRMFLVFRGTEEIADILADLRYVKTSFYGGGRVHEGFNHALGQVFNGLQVVMDDHPDRQWIFTGHSLGAALALLAAATWKPATAYLYGCPRVGNRAFVRAIECPIHRFENRGDVVTRLPPPTSPLQIWHSLTHGRRPTLYRQAGKRVRLAGFGHRARAYEASTVGVRVS